jgi:hypothetical protein
MTATRGARYLLRNGLDYVNYQQYERALKFLRDAEARKKELNDSEKQVLKEGIERAQRGLREAADAEAPYALSDRSRRPNGFTAARPETQVAASSERTKPSMRGVRANQPTPTRATESENGERGEPIQLASGEAIADDPATESNRSALPNQPRNAQVVVRSESNQPANMPEIPELPKDVPLPDLTATNGAEPLRTTGNQSTANSVPAQTAVPSEPSVPSPLPNLASTPDATSSVQIRVAESTASADNPGTVNSPAPQPQKTSVIDLETVPSSSAAESGPQSVNPNPPEEKKAPAESISTPNANSDAVPEPPTSTPPGIVAPTVDPSAPTRPDTVEAATAPKSSSDTPAQPTSAAGPVETTPADDEELPPLPPDLRRPAPATPAADAASAQPATVPGATAIQQEPPALEPTSPRDEELPPLPADLSGVGASLVGSTPPAAAGSAPASAAPVPPISHQDSVKVGAAGAPHTEDDPMPAPATDSEEKPALNAPGGQNHPAQGDPPLALPTASQNETSSTSPTGITAPATSSADENAALAVSPAFDAASAHMDTSIAPGTSSASANTELPPLPESDAVAAPNAVTHPDSSPAAGLGAQLPALGASAAEPVPDASSLPPAISNRTPGANSESFIPNRPNPASTLRPELQREVEKIARAQEDALTNQLQNPPQPEAPPRDMASSDLRTQTQLDISRAPSPAEARPIKAIPVPEDWVPLAPRSWSPQRKYWAAAATCHLPLYFQDPVLERYGHSVEQFVGPIGRFLTYPVDDPTQSTQRNQILQPFFSAGLMALQIAAWPYNLIMDPPWEAQYDLGYYRPGDNIPVDTYWLPLHGYGPPLHGSRY